MHQYQAPWNLFARTLEGFHRHVQLVLDRQLPFEATKKSRKLFWLHKNKEDSKNLTCLLSSIFKMFTKWTAVEQ